jgi:membrane-bound ClpP family serine protease
VVYVAPAPARAGSAGVFITMAADVAAMAPHTRIGAAHPVELGAGGEVEKTDDTMKTKIENDTAAFAQSIADKRHRNVDWAIASVRESASITSRGGAGQKRRRSARERSARSAQADWTDASERPDAAHRRRRWWKFR